MNVLAIPRVPLVAAVLLILIPLAVPSWIVFILTKAMFMFIAVMGVSVLLRGGLLTFGHALYYATGAYAVGFSVKWLGVQELLLLIPLGGVAGLVMAALVGLIMARYREVFFAMLNLAFSMILFGALLKFYWVTGGTDGLAIGTSGHSFAAFPGPDWPADPFTVQGGAVPIREQWPFRVSIGDSLQ